MEEYEGLKIDDILRYGVDVFAVGSDWKGFFDYLKEYCEVVYLERTAGASSFDLRAENSELRIGLVGGELSFLDLFEKEGRFINGADVSDAVSKAFVGIVEDFYSGKDLVII